MIDFIAHPHHRLTRSHEPFQNALGRPSRTLFGDEGTLREYLPTLAVSPPRLVVLWQLEHLAAYVSCFCPVLAFPMQDLTRQTPDSYLSFLREVRWISFSRHLHQRLAGLGLVCHWLQYAPDPCEFSEVSWEGGSRAYFWERVPTELDKLAAEKLRMALGVGSLKVRPLCDLKVQSAEDLPSQPSHWLDRCDYLQTLAQFNVFIAPRRHEGIGLSFLEAMAMGMCVLAENESTANEYIVSGKNGVLYSGDSFRLYAPQKPSDQALRAMGAEARQTIKTIHQSWVAQQGLLQAEVDHCVNQPVRLRKITPGLLQATLSFWRAPECLWGLVSNQANEPAIWRSQALAQKHSTRVQEKNRGFWKTTVWAFRHPRAGLLQLLQKKQASRFFAIDP